MSDMTFTQTIKTFDALVENRSSIFLKLYIKTEVSRRTPFFWVVMLHLRTNG